MNINIFLTVGCGEKCLKYTIGYYLTFGDTSI